MKKCVYGAQGFLLCPTIETISAESPIKEQFIGQQGIKSLSLNSNVHFNPYNPNASGIWDRCNPKTCSGVSCTGNNCLLQCTCKNCRDQSQQVKTSVALNLTDTAMKNTKLFYCGGQTITKDVPCKFASC